MKTISKIIALAAIALVLPFGFGPKASAAGPSDGLGNYGYNGYGYGNGYGNIGGLTLNPSTVNLNVGQSTYVAITSGVYMYAYPPYVSNNSNSSVASASISGNQLYVTGNSVGSTTVTVCLTGGSTCGSVYVTVGGGYNNGGQVTFSQTSVSLNAGQSQSVTINNNNYSYNNNYYISNNSNSSVATASVSGNNLYVYGQNTGHTAITVCRNGSNQCGTVYVSVNGGSNNGQIGLSQTSVNLNVGQNQLVTIYSSLSGSNSFYVSGNTSPGVVSANVSGNTLNVQGASNGSSTVTVCTSGSSYCAALYVTVTGNATISFSQTNVSLNTGQSTYITVNSNNSYSNNYYISSNSNSNAVSASISGSSLYLYGQNSGSSTITVCQNGASACNYVYVTVNGSGNNNPISLSQTSVNLNVNQNATVTVYNVGNSDITSGKVNISSISDSNVVQAYLTTDSSGRVVANLVAKQTGSATISVCGNYSSQCNNIFVTVSGYNNGSISLSQTSLNLNPGQTSSVTISGSGSYYISGNSNPNVVGVTLSSNILNVSAYTQGTANITVCQSGNSCLTLYVTVGGGYSTVSFSQTNVTINQGQSIPVTINNGYSSAGYYVSANTNADIVSASLTGNTLNLYGSKLGNTTVTVCQNNSTICASVNVTVASSNVLGNSAYNNGALINEGGTVYIIYKNTKTGFSSAPIFLGLGFRFENVVNAGTTNIPFSGYTVTTANASHPWGSWIKSGQTVYFVHELGLIPVPDYNTFLNNGGSDNLVVPANSYDFARPMLSVMTASDTRLK